MAQVFVLKQPTTFIFFMKTKFAKLTKLLSNIGALMESLKYKLLKNLKMKTKF